MYKLNRKEMKLTILCSVLYFERRLVWFLKRENISKCSREDKCIEQGISLALKWPVCVCVMLNLAWEEQYFE